MASKSWKVGEWSDGGIIKVVVNGKVTVQALDWFTKTPMKTKTVELDQPNTRKNIKDFLDRITTPYFTSKVLEWVDTKL
ncbi:MAG TPA: hypothetical protein VK172_10570 [Lentimicrobium sp.]|nr:hypothetical protein [Lentimicrobium sp.]